MVADRVCRIAAAVDLIIGQVAGASIFEPLIADIALVEAHHEIAVVAAIGRVAIMEEVGVARHLPVELRAALTAQHMDAAHLAAGQFGDQRVEDILHLDTVGGEVQPVLIVGLIVLERAVDAARIDLAAIVERIFDRAVEADRLAHAGIVAQFEPGDADAVATAARLIIVGRPVALVVGAGKHEAQLPIAEPVPIEQAGEIAGLVGLFGIIAAHGGLQHALVRRRLGDEIDRSADRVPLHIRRDRLGDDDLVD